MINCPVWRTNGIELSFGCIVERKGLCISGGAVEKTKSRQRGKGMFLYSAVSSPLDSSKRFTLFLPWQTCSFRHQLGFSWKHSNNASITAPLSIVRYSFIQLRQLGCQWGERMPNLRNGSRGGFEPGSVDCEHSTAELPRSTRKKKTYQ